METYNVEHQIPTLKEYQYLCESVGWADAINFEAAEASLGNSLYCLTVRDQGQIAGMGRIVGDGAIYFYIQDIVVHPDYQRKGLGNKIMSLLTEYLQENAPDKAFIGLFASRGTEPFYEKYQFKNFSPNMTGMFTVISKKEA